MPSARLSAIAAFALLASDADGLAGFVIGSPKDESFVTVSAADQQFPEDPESLAKSRVSGQSFVNIRVVREVRAR